jgi:hypothetical protein
MVLYLLSLLACGPKAPKIETPVPTPVETEATPEVEEAELVPEEEPTPQIESNMKFDMTLTFANGTQKSGTVIRVERSADFPGLKEDWQDSEYKTTVFVESGSTAKDLKWTDVKSIRIQYGSVPQDVNCIYDSTWTPWMYDCALSTNTKLIDTNGKAWKVDSKYLWRMYFEGDTEPVDFWIQKPHATEQDDKEVSLHTTNPENMELYKKLQEYLKTESKTNMVVGITINP